MINFLFLFQYFSIPKTELLTLLCLTLIQPRIRSLSILNFTPTKLAANNRVAKSESFSEDYSALIRQRCNRLADSEFVPEEYSVFYSHKPELPCDKPEASKDPALSLFIVSALPVYFLTSKNKD